MTTRRGDVLQWDHYSDHPRVLLTSADRPLAVGMFEEVAYGPSGNWDFENRCLHFSALLTPAAHRSGGTSAPWKKVLPSTAVAAPGAEIRGGWNGRMTGRHLHVSPGDLAAILHGDDGAHRSFRTQGFREDGEPAQADHTVSALLDLIARDVEAGSPAGPTFAEHLVSALVAHVLEPEAPPVRSGDARLLRLTEDIVAARLGERLLLRDIAAELGLSVPHLARSFRAATGTSLHRFIVARRIERAKRLLRHTRLPLVEVALQSGFGDQSHLSRAIRQATGMTPTEYRRNG